MSSMSSSAGRRLEEGFAEEPRTAREWPEPLSGRYLHHDPDYPTSSFSVIDEMRVNGQLCDVSLRVGNSVTNVHKLVLASTIPYFHAMFTNETAEKLQSEVELHDVDFETLQLLIEYSYTGRVQHISDDNVEILSSASSLLHMGSVRDVWCTSSTHQLNVTNLLDIGQHADAHSCDASTQLASPNSEKVAKTKEFLSRSLSVMNEMRVNGQMCDVCFQVGNSLISAHRLVLASSSPYFYAMFNNDMAEKSQRVIELHDVDFDALRLLVEYSYTGRVLITDENFHVLLPASSFLQMGSVRDACCMFMTKELNETNCLGIRRLADTYSCDELTSRSHRYALHNFEQLSETEEFLGLSMSEIEDLVSDDKLYVVSEHRVFTAVDRWVKHDVAERSRHFARLLGHVRMALVSNECPRDLTDVPVTVQRRRCPDPIPYAFAVGGGEWNENRGTWSAVYGTGECYDPLHDRWLPMANMRCRRNQAAVAALGSRIYAVGGYDGTADLSSAECYDPERDEWSAVPALGAARKSAGACADHGALYVCGGFKRGFCARDLDRYDAATGVWSAGPVMAARRRSHRVTVVGGCLYAAGGHDSLACLSAAERYDPRTAAWTALPPMSVPRRNFAAAAQDDALQLYCVGGYGGTGTGTGRLSAGERFDLRRNAWEPIAAMRRARDSHDMVALDGQELLALGGFDGQSCLSSTERYDPRADRWTASTPMRACRAEVRAVSLGCFHLDAKLTSAVANHS